jgi:mannose-6-phosphate isomerase-like protein (cupin superfamily)
MSLAKIQVGDLARRLHQPFVLHPMAQVDHFTAFLYRCEGVVPQHRHMAQDELFFVYSGMMRLDSECGDVVLFQKELAVVPHGVMHASASLAPSVVLQLKAHTEAERKNGHGRLDAGGIETLPKWSVIEEIGNLSQPYLPLPLVQVDEMSLRLVLCHSATSWHHHPDHAELLYVLEGTLLIGSELGPVHLAKDELTVIPRNRIHRLVASERTIVLSMIHGQVSPQAHMGME